MAFDNTDLQQRRTTRSSKRRAATSSTVNRRRAVRTRKSSDANKNAAVVVILTILIAAIAIPIILISNHLIGSSGSSSSSISSPSTSDNRFLQQWKPKQSSAAENVISNGNKNSYTNNAAAQERTKQREERYKSLYRPKFDASTLGYDIYNCPFNPPPDYPKAWKTTEVLSNWNPNDVTTISPSYREVYHGLCIFDYTTQYNEALNYRNLEKPFVIKNDPRVMTVVDRWNDAEDDSVGEYLHRVFGDSDEFRTERSPNNQFMWYRLRGNKKGPKGYTRPKNDEIQMSFGEWLEHALEKDARALNDDKLMERANALKERRLSLSSNNNNNNNAPMQEEEDDPLGGGDDKTNNDEDSEESKEKKYYYFRLNADLRSAREASPSQFIYDELSIFDPRKRRDSEFYIVDPKQERGINCRFGMRGVTAVNHFDMSRNMIAIFGGERRYVLGHPSQCNKMALYPKGHPSVRHSSLDWSNPLEWDEHPQFKEAEVNEVVLHAGDVLYLPTNWFHYIVNLSLNYQCNARSGTTYETAHYIEDCGFGMKTG